MRFWGFLTLAATAALGCKGTDHEPVAVEKASPELPSRFSTAKTVAKEVPAHPSGTVPLVQSETGPLGSRRILIFDQSVSMLGFSRSGALQQIEDVVAAFFRQVEGNPVEFFGVAEDLKAAKPPLARSSSLRGRETNLEAAIKLLSQPDVRLGILVTDGLPSESDASKRPCYALNMPSVEPLAQTLFQVTLAGSGLWVIVAKVPFKGPAFLNCAVVASHDLPLIREAFGGKTPRCVSKTRDECRCGGECRVPYDGLKPLMFFVVSDSSAVENVRVSLVTLVKSLEQVQGVADVAAVEIYPGTPDVWTFEDGVSMHRLNLAQTQGNIRSTKMDATPGGSNRFVGNNLCLAGEDDEIVLEVCAKRRRSNIDVPHVLETSPPEVRFEAAQVIANSTTEMSTRILAQGLEFIFWDQGMVVPPEAGLVRTAEMSSCKELFTMVERRSDWRRPVPNAGKADWCRQVLVFCGCLAQEGKLGPNQTLRVAMELAYTVKPREDLIPEKIISYSVEDKPFLHPDKIFGLEKFLRMVVQNMSKAPNSTTERTFGQVEMVIRYSQ